MRILLASANDAVLSRWQSLLAQGNEIRQARTFADLKRQVSQHAPDLVMLHRHLVDAAACAELRALAPAAKLFLLSDSPEPDEGLAFLKAGIVGYANAYIAQEILVEALRVIGNDGVWLGRQVINQLIMEAAGARPPEPAPAGNGRRLAPLTPTEKRVAELVALGRTNLEVAAELGTVERTVKAHLTSIYGKLQVGNRLSLALLVQRG